MGFGGGEHGGFAWLVFLLVVVPRAYSSDPDWQEYSKDFGEEAAPDAWGDSDESSSDGNLSDESADEYGKKSSGSTTDRLIDAVRSCDAVKGRGLASALAEEVTALLEEGADPEASVATAGRRKKLVGMRVGPRKPKQVQSLLSLAVSKCCPAIVRALLAGGATPIEPAEGLLLVSAAARGPRSYLCPFTLDALDPTYESKRESLRVAMAADQERRTRSEEVVRMLPNADAATLSKLFEEGLDPNTIVERSPRLVISQERRDGLAGQKLGSSLDRTTFTSQGKGWAPLLHIAGTAERARTILAAGADVTRKDQTGASALQNAIREGVPMDGLYPEGHRSLIRVLLSSKAGRAMVHVDTTRSMVGNPFTMAVRKCDAPAVAEMIDTNAVVRSITSDLVALLRKEVQKRERALGIAKSSSEDYSLQEKRYQACADTLKQIQLL